MTNPQYAPSEHTPADGQMSFARWSSYGGFWFCSCGKWHWIDLPETTAEASND